MILGCFLEHKDTEESCSPNQNKISVIHKTLQPLLAKKKKEENHATAGSAAFCFFLKKKKKNRGGCYLAQSPMTLVLGSLWNTKLFNDANYKQRENIRRVCLEISLLDWKLASLIELAGLRFSLQSLELWSICINSLLSGTLGKVENERQEKLSYILMVEMIKLTSWIFRKCLQFSKEMLH